MLIRHVMCTLTSPCSLLFSLMALYFINQISQSTYSVPATSTANSKPGAQKATPKSPSGKNRSK